MSQMIAPTVFVHEGELAGITAVVTGASRGIGFAVARALCSAGARVHLLSRTASNIRRAAAELGANAVPHVCDVTDELSVADAVKAITAATDDAVGVLVNNAGIFPLQALGEMAVDQFAETLNTNVVSPYRMIKQFLPAMQERGRGHIVTIGSVADRFIFPGNGAYSASKYAQRALHEVLRTELRGSGVRTTIISPSATDTSIWDHVDATAVPGMPTRDQMLNVSDVADAVLFAVTRRAGVNIDELRLSLA